MSDYQPFVAPDVTETIAVYPGTFDPITMGHLDIIQRALHLFDKVIIAVAENAAKKTLFPLEERLEMIRNCFPPDDKRIEVAAVKGLLVDYAYTKGARVIVRGLRAVSDFDYEFQLALMNRRIEREVETVFLMTGFRWIYISSSIIKEAARHGGDVSGLVPDHVCEKLRQCFLVK
ncbi:MAG: pantetheine-phosphate adenylyltransferase [Proteobacteria bacterium]|nr:pantetheine-phosphate adenylyltransferase [Pseudomonadota bacterium]MBU4295168.1 pantetheine-phosphate adenylyltransferase [Pseudomonadota bacterium]MCG2749050.1 pantetheine-phosphate adenylyltransferase [Desulfobulbaceae bacterium]